MHPDRCRRGEPLRASVRVPLEILRCPATEQPLELRDDGLWSTDGTRRYPVVDGVPVLIDDERSLFAIDRVAASGSVAPATLKDRVKRSFPTGNLEPGAAERLRAFADRLGRLSAGAPATVLVVGGGTLGRGMPELVNDERVRLVESDVYLGPRVDVACDAHDLPFADGQFDGVVVQSVLEHVLDPHRVVAEIHRVLRPGGLVLAETPFMQQVHEGAHDFTRFSLLGHRRLFRYFDEVDSGVACGPAMALVWSLRYFARSIPPRSRLAAKALDRVVVLMFGWLKHLDRRLVTHVGAADAASSVYFVGTRATTALSDEDLVAGYDGTMASAAEPRGL